MIGRAGSLRILHVDKFASRRGGGATAYMLEMVEQQRRRGHDVELLSTEGEIDVPARYQARFPKRIVLDPPPRRLGEQAASVATMIWSRTAAAAMESVLDDFAPDVVHCHNIYHHLSPSILSPIRRRGVRCVLTVHDYKLVCPTYRLIDGRGESCDACVGGSVVHALRRRCQGGSLRQSAVLAVESGIHRAGRMYRGVDAFLCPSRFAAGLLGRAGYGSRVHVVPIGYAAAGVAVRTHPGQGVVYGGRLTNEKGVDHLIAAVAQLPGTTLTIAGDGPARAALERQAALELGDRAHFVGHVDRGRLVELFRSSAVVAVPSIWAENQPIVILEAMACGVPVVSGDAPALAELVEASGSGAIVDARDHGALARALARFIDDPGLAQQTGAAGREHVVRVHDMDDHLDCLETFYGGSHGEQASGQQGGMT